jgi:hypothetical protein
MAAWKSTTDQHAALEPTSSELSEVALDRVEPTRRGRREVEDETGVPAEPGADFRMLIDGVVVEDDGDDLPGRDLGLDEVEEADGLLMAAAPETASSCRVASHRRRHWRRAPAPAPYRGLGATPASRMMVLVPKPATVNRTIRQRQTCFCGLLRSATIALRWARSARLTVKLIPVSIPQTRTTPADAESLKGFQRWILSTRMSGNVRCQLLSRVVCVFI